MRKPWFLRRSGVMTLTVAAALVAGAFVLPMAIGTGAAEPVLDATSELPGPPENKIPASETAKVSPPLDLNTRIPPEALNPAETVAASVIPSAAGVVAQTAAELPIDDPDGLGFGELRVLLESNELVRFSWQRWDPAWDFQDFAGIDPQARQTELAGGRVALYRDAGGSRRSVTIWTGDLLLTVGVRSAIAGSAPKTTISQVEKWAVEFADGLTASGF